MSRAGNKGNTYQIGGGLYDITGPPLGLGMMGYGKSRQKTRGIFQRLRSRAFVVTQPTKKRCVVFVSADLAFITQAIKLEVVRRLRERYGDLYRDENVMLTATHTHTGPAGFSFHKLYNITIGRWPHAENFEVIVQGIVESIARAHENLEAGKVYVHEGDLYGASINRSRKAYLLNPDRKGYEEDTNKQMTVLKFLSASGDEIGTINWFSVHATSLGNKVRLISGDNKGLASTYFEKWKGTDYRAAKTFVAAFANSDEGDVSPNIYGGEEGGGQNDFESVVISAKTQFETARRLFDEAKEALTGDVDFGQVYISMEGYKVAEDFTTTGSEETLCKGELGKSFAAGADDGPSGVIGFWQGMKRKGAPKHCQHPKPILPIGKIFRKNLLPTVLPFQIVRVGSLVLLGVPGEITTMAGRRLRAHVLQRMQKKGVQRVVVAGLANTYSHYITTPEEYEAQRYEGASTLYGPHTFAAYLQIFGRLAEAMVNGKPMVSEVSPPELQPKKWKRSKISFSFLRQKRHRSSFGSVLKADVAPFYRRGQTARANFHAAHPNFDLLIQGSFLEVQRNENGEWVPIADDHDPSTKIEWKKVFYRSAWRRCLGATVQWEIPRDTPHGQYRLLHRGIYLDERGEKVTYEGTSSPFELTDG